MENLCKQCGSSLKGRCDKKFCDDQCRSSFHNRTRIHKHGPLRAIDKILKKNYAVLKKLSTKSNITVGREQMLMNGFDFRYRTHQFDAGNTVLYYCYDLAYTHDQNNDIIILGLRNSSLAMRQIAKCQK